MDQLISSENLVLFLNFGVPGIVILYARAQFLTGRMPPAAEGTITYVVVSVIYQALITLVTDQNPALHFSPESNTWIHAGFLFAAPALLGTAMGLNARNQWLQRALRKLGVHTIHPIASAWDWRFGKIHESWVLIHLKDGTQWAGRLGEGSFMSSDPIERDLYLVQVYEIDDDEQWHPRNSGVWISHGEISTIEIWQTN